MWLAFVLAWCLVYTGYHNRLHTDQGPAFTFKRWKSLTDLHGIQLRLSDIETRSYLSSGERYHKPLHRIYPKIRFTHPTVDPQNILKIAVKAMDDTMGINGIVPSRLLIETVSRFPISSTDQLLRNERKKATKTAQAEMNTIDAPYRTSEALMRNMPPAASCSYRMGEEVLEYYELEK